MRPQRLPSLASDFHVHQADAITSVVEEVVARFGSFGTRFDTAWLLAHPLVLETIYQAQRDLIRAAEAFVPAVLEETHQPIRSSGYEMEPAALVGYAGSGYTVDETLQWAPVRAKQAVESGATARTGALVAQEWLALTTTTILADTLRSATSVSMSTRRSHGYVRMVNGNACGRCVVLAGRWYRISADFDRHPRCKCTQIPAAENLAGDWQTDPQAYFDSLSDEARIKLMGSKANAQAVADGADIGQVINAYRKTAGMKFAQESPIIKRRLRSGAIDKYTTEGTTRRAIAAQQQAGLRRNGPLQQRLMPQSINRIATSEAERMRLLKLYGWVRDESAVVRGSAALTEARRIERNARAVLRRAERRAANQ